MNIGDLCNKSKWNGTYVLVWFVGMDVHSQLGIEFKNIEPVYDSSESSNMIGYKLRIDYTDQFYIKDQIISFAIIDTGEQDG